MSDVQPLQFDRAEFSSPEETPTTCANCKNAIVQSYYAVNGNLICSRCHEGLTLGIDGGRSGRVLRAVAAGFGVAILGAILWWGVRKVTGYEVGLISIAIGIGVGKAVRWGSRNRGGWAYQLIAILLTYAAVAGNYMPDTIEGMLDAAKKDEAAVAKAATPAPKPSVQKASAVGSTKEELNVFKLLFALAVVFVIAAAAPFLAGAENIIGLLIIAFGLYEAWKINRRVPMVIAGPFSAAPSAPLPPPNV